jgi:hypothetical protein
MPAPAADQKPSATAATDPRTIRAKLIPEEVGDFDREYREVMAVAIESRDLNPVWEMLERWRRVARVSEDPDAHRRMLETARRLQAGEHVPTTPWSEIKTRLGL